jgi:hypothetical protein
VPRRSDHEGRQPPSVGGKARIGYEKYLYGALGALGIGIGRAAVKNPTDDATDAAPGQPPDQDHLQR